LLTYLLTYLKIHYFHKFFSPQTAAVLLIGLSLPTFLFDFVCSLFACLLYFVSVTFV